MNVFESPRGRPIVRCPAERCDYEYDFWDHPGTCHVCNKTIHAKEDVRIVPIVPSRPLRPNGMPLHVHAKVCSDACKMQAMKKWIRWHLLKS